MFKYMLFAALLAFAAAKPLVYETYPSYPFAAAYTAPVAAAYTAPLAYSSPYYSAYGYGYGYAPYTASAYYLR